MANTKSMAKTMAQAQAIPVAQAVAVTEADAVAMAQSDAVSMAQVAGGGLSLAPCPGRRAGGQQDHAL